MRKHRRHKTQKQQENIFMSLKTELETLVQRENALELKAAAGRQKAQQKRSRKEIC